MTRVDDWEQALVAAVNDRQNEPFRWGGADCVSLARACVIAVTGNDPVPDLPAYDSEAGAGEAIAALGHASLADALRARFAEIHPATAGRGDLGIIAEHGREAMVVCVGPYFVGRQPVAGTVRAERSRVAVAFRV